MISRPVDRARVALFLLPVAVALVLRLLVARRAGLIESDGAYYAWLAEAMLRGDWRLGVSTVWPPLYPALIAAVAGLARLAGVPPSPQSLETAARAVSIVMGVGLLAPLALLARRVAGARVAVIAVAYAAVHPHLVQLSGAALTEATFTALLVAAVAAWCHGRGALAGVALGLATLARPEGAVLALGLGLAGAVARGDSPPPRWGYALAFTLLVLPYAAFVTVETGTPSLGEKGAYNFWRAYQTEYARVLPAPVGLSERVVDSPDLASRLPRVRPDVAGFLVRAPGVVVGRTLSQLPRLAFDSLPLAAAPAFALLAVVGAWVAPWRRAWPMALPIGLSVLLYAPLSTDRRFLMPVVPLVLVFAAIGTEAAAAWLSRSSPAAKSRAIVTLAAVVAVGHAAYTLVRTHGIDEAPEHWAAGVWLADHPQAWRAAPDSAAAVMSRKPWVAYYAHASHAELPSGDFAAVATRMRETGTRVLVIDARWGVPQRPALRPLLDPAPNRAALILSIDGPQPLRLYRAPDLVAVHAGRPVAAGERRD